VTREAVVLAFTLAFALVIWVVTYRLIGGSLSMEWTEPAEWRPSWVLRWRSLVATGAGAVAAILLYNLANALNGVGGP
jgi:hypothetical protein